MIDTAMVYGTEIGVGRAIQKLVNDGNCKREDMFITTKIPPIFDQIDEVRNQGCRRAEAEFNWLKNTLSQILFIEV